MTMQKLRKQDRRRFDDVCRKIREALHLEHWHTDYQFTNKDEGHTATCHHPPLGNRRVWIHVHKSFWELDGDYQLRVLIHEHVHAALLPYDQAGKAVIQRLHMADTELAEQMFCLDAAEQVTDHLTSVMYDLIRDRF